MPARTSHLDPAFERALREVIYDRKLPCPHCRYDLRGIVGSICPECGHDVEHHLRIADLSPGRIRARRIENALRLTIRLIAVMVLVGPLVVAVILALS